MKVSNRLKESHGVSTFRKFFEKFGGACPYRGTLNCIKIRATNEMPNYFNGGRQAPALRRNCIAFLATKKDGMQSVCSKDRPRSRATRAPAGFDSVPPVSFLSDTSYRAMARYEPSRTAKRHRAKRRWNLGRDSAQDDAGGIRLTICRIISTAAPRHRPTTHLYHMPCNERNAALFRRAINDRPYRGEGMSHRNRPSAAINRRRAVGRGAFALANMCPAVFPNDMLRRDGGRSPASRTASHVAPTENPQIASNSVQRMKCGGVSTAAPRHRPTIFALNRIQCRAKTDGYNIRPYRDKI